MLSHWLLKPNHWAQLIPPPNTPKLCQSNHNLPQFCPGVMGPSLAPGQTLPRVVETGLFPPKIEFPASQWAILAGV